MNGIDIMIRPVFKIGVRFRDTRDGFLLSANNIKIDGMDKFVVPDENDPIRSIAYEIEIDVSSHILNNVEKYLKDPMLTEYRKMFRDLQDGK